MAQIFIHKWEMAASSSNCSPWACKPSGPKKAEHTEPQSATLFQGTVENGIRCRVFASHVTHAFEFAHAGLP